jgi:UDP-4-amino-4-deoxy-L-arabinose-oxoglutarate aminotransferase
MVCLGWKYNMDNIQAALLLPQMDRLERNWQLREQAARRYHELLDGIPHLTWPRTLPGVRHARHLFPVWLLSERRDEMLQAFQQRQIGVVVNYRAIHLLTYFRELLGTRRGDFPHAEHIGESTISLPFYPLIPNDHLDSVAAVLRGTLGRERQAA